MSVIVLERGNCLEIGNPEVGQSIVLTHEEVMHMVELIYQIFGDSPFRSDIENDDSSD